MRVHADINGTELEATVPYDGADHVTVEGACPSCGHAGPVKLQGLGVDERGHDYERCRARAACCGQVVGTITVTYSTIFGIEEDRAVLEGRCRVY